MYVLEFPRSLVIAGLTVLVLAFSPTTGEPIRMQQLAPPDDPFHLHLPTPNDALFEGHYNQFYQYVNRYVDGQNLRPWQGGTYGFVRNPWEVGGTIVYVRMHEGIDIKPIYRGRYNEPLDTVRTISGGRVVYTNRVAWKSDYGKYVVVEHAWDGGPFYSLYAHLAEIYVEEGDRVQMGERLGRMGYTGAGIGRRRAHLHLELGMLLNRQFQTWYDEYFGGEPNYHDIFSGLNLKGLNIGAFFKMHRQNPSLSAKEFILSRDAAFSIAIPNAEPLDLLERYPWLLHETEALPLDAAPSLVISFTRTGLPIRIEPSAMMVSEPIVSNVQNEAVARWCITNGVLTEAGSDCRISRSGQRYVDLITVQG